MGTKLGPKIHVHDQAGLYCAGIKGPGVICFRQCFAFTSALPQRATEATAELCGAGLGWILLSRAPQAQHQEPGWALTDLMGSAPHLMGENGSQEAKQPSLAQLLKLESLP